MLTKSLANHDAGAPLRKSRHTTDRVLSTNFVWKWTAWLTALVLAVSGPWFPSKVKAAAVESGGIERLSVSSGGVEGDHHTRMSVVSGDGRYVAFESEANNLVSGDTNTGQDIFIRDRKLGVTELVSTNSQTSAGYSQIPDMSRDGRFVVYQTIGIGSSTVYLHDRQSKTTQRVNETGIYAESPAISADGRFVAYHAIKDGKLVALKVWDRATGVTESIQYHVGTRYLMFRPAISLDGRYVTYHIRHQDGLDYVIWYDRVSGVQKMRSARANGYLSMSDDGRYVGVCAGAMYRWDVTENKIQGPPGECVYAGGGDMSGDGNIVVYVSTDQYQKQWKLYGHNYLTGETVLLASTNGNLVNPAISWDGGYVAFASIDNTLVLDDRNGKQDLFGLGLPSTKAVVLNRNTINLTEGDSPGDYTVRLSGRPDADVMVTITPDSQVSVAPTTLTFTSTNWETPQTVTVQAQVDGMVEGPHSGMVQHSVTSADSSYHGRSAPNVTVSITDVDFTGLAVTPESLALAEGGTSKALQIALRSQPTANVVVTPQSGLSLEASPPALTFTPTNWSVPQTLTVRALNDGIPQGPRTEQIGYTLISTDQRYGGLAVTPTTVTITDIASPTLGFGVSVGEVWTQPSLPLVGTAPAGAEVIVYAENPEMGDSHTATTTADPEGWFTVTIVGIHDGQSQFRAEAWGLWSNTISLRIDSRPPVTTATASPVGSSGWYREPVTLTMVATDGLGGLGVDRIEVSGDGGTTWSLYPVTGIFYEAEGIHSSWYRALDKAGNVEPTQSFEIRIDMTPPQVMIGFDPGTGRITPTASDALSGVERTEFSLDGGNTWQVFAEPSPQLAEGVYTVLYQSRDWAGNTASGEIVINIDQTPPTITGIQKPLPNPYGWNNTDVTVSFTCSDTGSGVSDCPAPALFTQEGSDQSLTVTATDVAGNTAPLTVSGISIDKSLPTIAGALETPQNANGWYNTDVTVTFTCADTLSGIASCNLPVTLKQEGADLSATGTATDRAGNMGSATVGGIRIDRSGPMISVTGLVDGGQYDDTVSPAWAVTDGLSGLAEVSATLDGIPWTSGQPVSGLGPHVLTVKAVDQAGNVSNFSVSFTVWHLPALNLAVPSGQYSDPAGIQVVLLDGATPVVGAPITFRINGMEMGTVLTDPLGVARYDQPIGLPEGTYVVQATYAGDADGYLRATVSSDSLTVVTESATVTFTGDGVTFSGQVDEEADGFTGDRTLTSIRFEVAQVNLDGTTTPLPALTTPVSASGVASIASGLPEGIYQVATILEVNGYYTAAPVTVTLSVTNGQGCTLGNGWWLPGGGKPGGGGKPTEPGSGKPDHQQVSFNLCENAGAIASGDFSFQNDTLKLNVTNFDWLVVTPQNAQFRGRSGSYLVQAGVTSGKGQTQGMLTLTIWENGAKIYEVIDQPIQGMIQNTQL